MLEVIAGSLAWAPGLWAPGIEALPASSSPVELVLALSLSGGGEADNVHSLQYEVTHYAPNAVGHCFGPLSLECMLRFCRALAARLEAGGGVVALTTPPGDENARTNASVLVGAYLMLVIDWPLEKVIQVLGHEAGRGFLCSWARTETPDSQRNLRVRHCWAGIAAMKKKGWIDSICLESDAATKTSCDTLRSWAHSYDSVWIIPGLIMVCADPVTTVSDPNPATFRDVFPVEVEDDVDKEFPFDSTNSKSETSLKEGADQDYSNATTASSKSATLRGGENVYFNTPPDGQVSPVVELFWSTAEKADEEPGDMLGPLSPHSLIIAPGISEPTTSPTKSTHHSISKASSRTQPRQNRAMSNVSTSVPRRDASQKSMQSVISACKDYDYQDSVPLVSGAKPVAFVTFLRKANISFIVRTNFDDEPGMPKGGSYSAKEMPSYGFGHADIKIVDMNGGLPRRQDVAKLLKVCPELDLASDGGVVVHCKGGFGRSVVLACCLAIDRFDISGEALLGWCRIARPGAVNTPHQELFLMSLKGRADVRKYAGFGLDGMDPTCGCSLQ